MTPEQVLSLLDLHASRTFPHTWKTVSRRRRQLAHRMPVNRKQIRRANYAAIQTLYHQRRKDAASAVLDGSWKDLYKGNCGLPPDAEQYWKQVLSAPKHVDSRPSRVIVPSDWSLIEPITGEEVGRTVRSMGNSSPGLDKLTPRMLRRFNANVLAGYFNLLLLAGGCPPHMCRARITLVPKVHNPTSPDQLRPISVSSILVRCFHKVLADRWSRRLQLQTSGASAPVPTSTQERLVGLTCEECGKWCKSKAGLVAHHRVHDNDSVGTNMVAQLACADCSRLFPTKIGLSQHRRHAHPTQHNADKLSRVKHSGARWSQQESQSLLRLANSLYPSCETQTALFARLEQYFPGRSAISIKTRLRVLNWQAQQDESSSGGPDQTIGQIAAYSSEADDYSVWFKQTVDCAVSLLESHADSSLASVDLEFSLAIISALRVIGCDVDFLVHQPMIISYRGICFPQSTKAVIGLGLSKVTVSDLCLLAIVGSLRTYDTFMRGTWR
ncbi:retrovirus-related Pol polyprotein from type-1 retrotransposable element R2 [Clonorchis sinensis]|uniref:Retrovirus-related Pol polyprotein from type-1 retrotransposable element R2 n=1 Tax=Clonorchis sinensis TaxID=79923 RepID=G7YSG7_CLOSI|nr:retrovirus-related Pol polyprotein from type-1 retrotransposable element R2 [Clonorchis sinensis]